MNNDIVGRTVNISVLKILTEMKRFKNTEVEMNKVVKQASVWERVKKQKLLLLMMVPGLVLTFIFKFIRMFGVLFDFKVYNPLN